MSAKPLSPARQMIFHQMLVAARRTALMDALSGTLGQIDPAVLKKQISQCVPKEAQKLLASAGIRDEHVFPVPAILERQPTLVGCGTGVLTCVFVVADHPHIEAFCTIMAEHLAELVRQISPKITARGVAELPRLTLVTPCGAGWHPAAIGNRPCW